MNIWENAKDKEWADLARRTEPFVDVLTGRNDIYVTVRPDLRSEQEQKDDYLHAGVFTPDLARIAFNPNHLFDKDIVVSVVDVDPMSPRSRRKYPEYTGCIVHESSHGRHSNYILPPLEGKIAFWVAMIEEPRSERHLLEDFPQHAVFVKSLVTNVLGGSQFFGGETFKNQSEELQRRYQAGQLCFLIMARAEYGVYDWTELVESEKVLRDILGDEDYDKMNDLWVEAIEIEDDQPELIIELAKRVQLLIDPENKLGEQPEQEGAEAPCGASFGTPQDGEGEEGEEGEGEGSKGSSISIKVSRRGRGNESEDEEAEGSGGEGEGSEGEGEGSDSEGGEGSEGEDKDSKDKGSKGEGSDSGEAEGKDGKDKGEGSSPSRSKLDGVIHDAIRKELTKIAEEAKKEIAESGQKPGLEFNRNQAEEDAQHRKTADAAKSKIKAAGKGTGNGYGWYNALTLNQRDPKGADISRARAIEVALRQAQYREVMKTSVRSMTPPGRLSMRGMVAREGQVAARQEITATPWAQTRRRTVDNPPITLAIASDISGSMDYYQQEVGSFSWAFGHAVRRLQGKVGAVAWDSAVHEYIKPGIALDRIPYYSGGGASDGLPSAIFALDGLMNLSFGEGVRVLAVITDGLLPNEKLIQERINLLHGYGVQVLWILTESRGFKPKNTTVAVLEDPADFGKIVGRKTIELLAQA